MGYNLWDWETVLRARTEQEIFFSPKCTHIEDLMLSPKALHSSSKSRQVGRQAKVFRRCFIFNNVNSYTLFVKHAHFLHGSRPILGPRRLDFGITLNTPRSVGILWTSDRPVAQTAIWKHIQHSQETDILVPGEIRNRNPNNRLPENPRLRPRGHDHVYFAVKWKQ
jgi:hypothetical protein